MPDDSGSFRRGGKKPPPKTFGDARLGIPSGTRREESGGAAREQPAVTEEQHTRPAGPIVERRSAGMNVRRSATESRPPPPPAEKPSNRAFLKEAAPLRPSIPPPAPEIPAPVETESFAELFERSSGKRTRWAVGQRLSARLIQLGKETSFLDLGGKGEGLIESRELRDEAGQSRFKVGDPIEGYIRSVDEGVWITTALPKGAQREALAQAQQSGVPVEGTVTGINKGGLEVDLGNGLRGFVPASQASLRFTPDLSAFAGQRLKFLVTQLKDRDVVLSRRALLEREAKAQAEELRAHLEVGSQLEGTVTSVREFGVFVDLGGIEGLLPLSEMSHQRVSRPEDLFVLGQRVTVEVLRIEPGKPEAGGVSRERIALSLKALEADPWEAQGNAIVEGQRLKGKVVRLQPFGAFVELLPGVDGLIHTSQLRVAEGRRPVHPEEVLKVGQELSVEVESIDPTTRKISLRPLTAEEAARPPAARTGAPGSGMSLWRRSTKWRILASSSAGAVGAAWSPPPSWEVPAAATCASTGCWIPRSRSPSPTSIRAAESGSLRRRRSWRKSVPKWPST